MKIKAADVAKLRNMTGAGMVDCKKALAETNCDFDAAVDLLRKKGQKVASKRADREASEGAVLAGVSADNKTASYVVLNCETDFVAKNEDFVKFTKSILEVALESKPNSLDELKELKIGEKTIGDEVTNQTGVIGEKIDLSKFDSITAEHVVAYVHQGNKLAAIAGFNQANVDAQVAKDVAMQIASMNPIAVDKGDVSQETVDKELEIGKELAIQEGKPADLAEKISKGRLNKFFKENTLLNQDFVKDSKMTIKEYLDKSSKGLTVTEFKRFSLN